MNPLPPGVLFVGSFFSNVPGTSSPSEGLASYLEGHGWNVFRTSGYLERIPRLRDMMMTAWRLRDRYCVAHVDVFSGAAFVWAESVCWVLRRARKPYVLTLHGGNLPAFAKRWPNRVRRLLQSASIVTTPSQYLQEQMKPYRAQFELLPNPLEVNEYRYRLRSSAGPRLVWLRAFHEIYNPVLGVRVVAALVKEYPEITLTMVGRDKGDGSFQQARAEALALGVEKHVEFPGGVSKNEVPQWLERYDIFLNTTNVDNTPVSVLEAMASGLCVVSTNVGGIPYLLEDGQDALLVPPDDVEAMAGAVRRILRDRGLAEQLSRNGRKKTEEFDWSRMLPRWDQLIHSLDIDPMETLNS